MSTPTTIALTGATGHIAAAILPLMLGKGYQVKVLQHRQASSTENAQVSAVHGSMADFASLEKLVAGCEFVIHCAGKISINSNRDTSVYETNVTGTHLLLQAAREAGVGRFLYLSSIHAYSQAPPLEVPDETRAFCPDTAPQYDRSKRDAQKLVLAEHGGPMEVVVLNPTSVIGPGDQRPSLLGKAIMDIYLRKIPMLLHGGFDFCDVRDVAQGVANALDHGRSGEAYLLGGKCHSLADLQELILQEKPHARRLPVVTAAIAYLGLPFFGAWAAIRKQEPLFTRESLDTLVQGNKYISSLKAETELGYTRRPLAETITDTLHWFTQAGYLP